MLARRQGQGERLDDPLNEAVLQLEDVLQRHLVGLRPDQSSAGRLHELGRDPKLCVRSEERAGQGDVYLRFGGDALQIRALPGEASGGQARADNERIQPGQGAGDRVGKAEREEIGVRIGAQHPQR